MNKKLVLNSLSMATAAAGLAASAPGAQAQQNYQDLRGQVMGLSGVFLYDVVVVEPLSTSFGGTATLTGSSGISFPFNTTGPENDSTLTANVPLPSFLIGSNTLALPTLSATGFFNETTGVFNEYAQLPGAIPVTAVVSGLTLQVTITNPNLSLVGQAINPTQTCAAFPSCEDSAIIVNTTEPNLGYTGISGTVDSVLGITLSTLVAQLTSWTLTAVPGPDSLAVFLPGMMLGGLAILRRRRRNIDRN